nr:MAG TPA: hypothetical protein [Caudoviricetes sp.]
MPSSSFCSTVTRAGGKGRLIVDGAVAIVNKFQIVLHL